MVLNPLLPRRNNNVPEALSSGDFEVVESAPAPRREGDRARAMHPTIPPPAQNPLANPRGLRGQHARSFVPQALPSHLPPARPVYQQRMNAPVPQNDAELQRFLAQFEPRQSGRDRPSTAPLAVQPARVREEPQPRFGAPFVRTATPVVPHAAGSASSTSSLAPVALSDETGAQSIITSPTFVIPPTRTRVSWAIFMVAMGGLVGVFVSMAVMKYRAEKLALAAQESHIAMAAAPPAQPAFALPVGAAPAQGPVQPSTATQPPTIFATTMRPATSTPTSTSTRTSTRTSTSTPTPTPTSMPTSTSTPTPTSTKTAATAATPGSKSAKKAPVVAAPVHHSASGAKAPPSQPVTTTTVRPSAAPKGDSAEQMLQAAKRETGTTLE